MAMIKCPECGKEISDKADKCPGCGCPNTEWNNATSNTINKNEKIAQEIVKKHNKDNKKRTNMIKELRELTGIGLKEAMDEIDKLLSCNVSISNKEKFNGIYKQTFLHGLKEVRCPRCGSEDCSHYQEQKIIPGKTKTRYTANLNPLKPFTLVNKKEKVVRKEEILTQNKFVCNKCGKIFN